MGRVVASAVYSAGRKVTNISIDEGSEWACKPGHFVWISPGNRIYDVGPEPP
jgi:magnesium transporter